MKFRSERDALQEALATASRAAATRGGALPVLSGVLVSVTLTGYAPLVQSLAEQPSDALLLVLRAP